MLTKSGLVLVFNMIGWDGGTSFQDQSQTEKSQAQPKQSWITCETQLKTDLNGNPSETDHDKYCVTFFFNGLLTF